MTSIVIIRYLTPSEYGDYQFLMSIFVAIFTFSNLNTQNGYFTFLSQKKESILFYWHYLIWEILQLLLVLVVSSFLLLSHLVNPFLGLDLGVVILALIAVFFTKNIREMITNTFESRRMTTYYLKFTFLINLIHFLIILFCSLNKLLNIKIIFLLIILEFATYLAISILVFWKRRNSFVCKVNYLMRENLRRYYHYSKPLFYSSLMGFIYLFLERWFLQKYGGPIQQAYLAFSIQFSTIILILTTSVLKVFWKEVAEHISNKNMQNLEKLFMKATKNIYIITSLISLFFIFNAKNIIIVVYGEKYLPGIYVFMLISFYTIHQTLGQLYGTFLLASEETRYYSCVSVLFTALAIPLMFFMVAGKSQYGLNLGAIGIATVMVSIQLFSVSSLGYLIKKKFGFKSMFLFQFKYLVIFALLIFISSLCIKFFVGNIFIQLILESLFLLLILSYIYFRNIKEVFVAKSLK